MSLNIKVTEQACGAEITGVDLTKSLSVNEIKKIREAWLEHHVLSLDPTDQNPLHSFLKDCKLHLPPQ
jgi:taurine dioxygenase